MTTKSEASKLERSMDGVRESLFDALDKLRDGTIDARQAIARAHIASALIKSVEVQINYERLKLDSKVPAKLPAMPLLPALANAR